MKMVALNEIAELIDYGVTASANAEAVGPKFLRITDIQDGAVNWDTVPYCEADARKLRTSRLAVGDIVFARTGATTGKSFLIRSCPESAVFASYLIRVRPSGAVHPEFLAQFFDSQSYWDQITLKSAGAAQPGVNASKLAELEIPLPPLEEQKRIAAILDQADALRRLRARALTRLNALGQAIFHEMFGDCVANSKGFQQVKVEDVIAGFETGKNLAEDPDGGQSGAIRVLKISAVTSGVFKSHESKPLPSNYLPPASHFVREGDILFSRANTEELIGATAIVNERPTNLVLPDKLWRFVWRNPSPVEPRFMLALLSSRPFRAEIGKRATGTSGSMKNIGQKKVFQIPFGLPPLEDQLVYVAKMDELEAQLQASVFASTASETLFTSLQHRAFRGEL